MFSTRKREAPTLRVLVTAVGVCLLTNCPTPTPVVSPQIEPLEVETIATQMRATECRSVLDAMDKLFTVPFHMYMTQTNLGIEGRKTFTFEVIFVNGVRYVMVNGKWKPSRLSTQELKAMDERNRIDGTNLSCQWVRDESVNSERAAVYSTHSKSDYGTNDNHVWISKRNGLVLRQETDLERDGGTHKSHLSVRYEYRSVRPPLP
jgi:hypothetical protein